MFCPKTSPRNLLPSLILALLVLPSALLADAATDLIQSGLQGVSGKAAFKAQKKLLGMKADEVTPQASKLIGKVGKNQEKEAFLLGVLLAFGEDRWKDGEKLLKSDSDQAQALILYPLAMRGSPPESWKARLEELSKKGSKNVKKLAPKAMARIGGGGGGSLGSVLGFLFMLGLAVLGALGWAAKQAAGNLDMMKGHVIKWTSTPADRDRTLKVIKGGEEDPVPQLVTYFDSDLSPAEVGGLCDLLSNFENPQALAAVREATKHPHDLVRAGAVQALAAFQDPSVITDLQHHLASDDIISASAAARGLAERGDKTQLPTMRARHAQAQPGSLKDALRDAIQRLEGPGAD